MIRPLNPYIRAAYLLIFTVFLLVASSDAAHAAAVLRENARGGDVLTLQRKLSALGYDIASVDGIFGPETKRAVLLFQREKRLKMTGVVDQKTWKALNSAKPRAKKKVKAKPGPKAAAPVIARETGPLLHSPKQIPAIIATAKKFMGTPYKFGGTTPKGFDCSGYVQYVFAQHNVRLPRGADEQFNIGRNVRQADLQSGDLVFFSTYEKGASHLGIYIGAGKFIHVSTAKGVRVDALKDAYWKPKYLGAKRLTK